MEAGNAHAAGFGGGRLTAALLVSAALHVGAGMLPSGAQSGGVALPLRPAARLTVVASSATRPQASAQEAPRPATTVAALPAGETAAIPAVDGRSGTGGEARYFLPGELTERARVEDMASLEPPEILGLLGDGTLRVEILLDAAGRVDDVRVLQRSVPDVFAEYAVAVFRQASYRPGRIFDRPVPSLMQIDISLAPLRPEFISPIERSPPL